jgi:hypothetical protein
VRIASIHEEKKAFRVMRPARTIGQIGLPDRDDALRELSDSEILIDSRTSVKVPES